MGEIPALEALMVTVSRPCFIQKGLIDVDFLPPGPAVPMVTGIIGAEEHINAVLVREGEKQLADVFINGEQVGNRFCREDALVLVTRADDDDRINPDLGVKLKFLFPVFFAPVLAWNVVGDLVKEGTANF